MSSEHVLNEINQSIAERSDITVASLSDELLASDEPLVLRGLASDWPAVKHGLESTDRVIEYLQGFDSGNVVTALYAPSEAGGRIFYTEDASIILENSRFPDVFAEDEQADALGLDNVSEQVKGVGEPPVLRRKRNRVSGPAEMVLSMK